MDEENKSTENIGDGNKPQSTPLIDSTNAAAERLEKALALQKAENDRTERIVSDAKLSGTAGGFIQTIPVDPLVAKKEAAAKFFEGTSLANDIRNA